MELKNDNNDNGSSESYSSYEEIVKPHSSYDDDDGYVVYEPNDNNGDAENRHRLGTYDETFEATGFGRWHALLLLQCGWANASDAIEIMCISFTISSIHESLHLSNQMLMWLTVMLFLGMMVGGYMWGALADSWGRRQIIMFSLAINGIFGCVSAFVEAYWLLLLFRFLSGVGAGGSLPVCFSYFSEFQPKEKRGMMISALATFWMAGNLLTAGLAWAILPNERRLTSFSPYGEQWRLFIIVCAIPSITSAFFFVLMPESPKFLMEKGKSAEAFAVLKKIYRFNNPAGNNFLYDGIAASDNALDPLINRTSEESHTHYVRQSLRSNRFRKTRFVCNPAKIFRSIYKFFASIGHTMQLQFLTICGSNSNSRKTSIAMIIIYCSIAFGGYGMTMWLPTLMDKIEKFGSPCSTGSNENSSGVSTASPSNGSDTSMYIDVLIGAAAQLPANVLTILIVDIVGGRWVLIVNFALSALSVLFFWALKTKTQVIVMSAVFNAVSTMVWNGVDVVTPEMYDTSVRASASGFLSALSRIASIAGNLIFGLFIDANCSVPILTVCALLLSGSVASYFLPNTRRTGLR